MMDIKTLLIAHCSEILVKEGDIVEYGTPLARQGNTGYSFGAHVHLGVVDGALDAPWWMYEATPYTSSRLKPNKKQMTFFLFDDFFYPGKKNGNTRDKILITTDFGGYKDHYAYDFIRSDYAGDPTMFWNRSMKGKVVKVLDQGEKVRYGKMLMIQYDANGVNQDGKSAEVIRKNTINLRDTPDVINGKTISQVKRGQKLTIVGEVEDRFGVPWYKLSNGLFIHSAFVKLI